MNASIRLYKAALVAAFGRNSARPFRSSLLRLSGICASAAGLSWLLAKGVAELPAIMAPNKAFVVLLAALAVQLAVLFVLLASLGITRSTNSDVLARLLLLLPVNNTQRWLALLLPSLVLVMVTLILLAWPVASFLSKTGLPPLLFAAVGTFGSITALGAVHGIPRNNYWVQVPGIPLLVWGEYRLAGIISNATSSRVSQLAVLLLLLSIFAGLCLLCFRSSKHMASDISCSTRGKNVTGASLPASLWFAKKVARARATQLGFVTTFGISVFCAIFLARQRIDPYMSIVLASILAAAFASDIRSLVRHTRPAEITALRATSRFVTAHIAAAFPYALLAVSPLIVSAAIAGNTAMTLAGFGAQLLFGVSAGVLAGTLVVPGRRDIMGQLVATLSCTGILLATPYLPIVRQLDVVGTTIFMCALAALLLAASWAIEYRRNNFNWR